MINKTLTIVGALALSLAAIAQTAPSSVGNVTNAQGLVTMSDGTTFATAAPGSAVVDGTRFITSTGANVTITLNSGCVITLDANQSVTILQNLSCAQLQASIQPAGAAAGGGAFAGGILPASLVGAGLLAINNEKLSGQ